MNRRLILLGLATGAASPVLAQSGSAVPMGGGAAPAAGAPISLPEVEHGKKTAITGAAALESSDIALKKARDPRVKQFAQFERDEQTTIAEILRSIDPSMGRANPDPKMADVIQKLNGMQAGAEFDKAYVTAQIEGHGILLQIQEDYLKIGKSREHVGIAKLARGMIKEHLVLLTEMQKGLS
jgi:putative membrane protein